MQSLTKLQYPIQGTYSSSELWVTVSRHHSSLHFKMNDKIHTVNVDNFREMLQIYPKLPGQKFEDPPFEEEILSFSRDLGHTGKIKVLSDVNVNHMHQPWRSFAAIINKCLSGKTTTLESLFLSGAQILWGMYHNKRVDYVYLLWEDLVYQVENKNSKKNNDIEKIPKPKYVKNKAYPESSPKKKSAQASEGKRLKTSAKVTKTAKKKQPATTSKAKGLNVGSGVDEGTGVTPGVLNVPTYDSDDEQISWKSSEEDDDDEVNVSEDDDNPNDDDDNEDDNEVNVSEDDDDQNDDNADNEGDDDQDDDNEQTESDNNDNDLVHPKLSTFYEKERQYEEDKEEEWFDDEAYDDETQ
ncbi:hypothetical protein Tco_1506429 [Tanacetum coccineum]